MAQGRFVYTKISLSERVADLTVLGQLFYTWAIVHSDDVGLLQSSAKTLKAQIIPMIDISVKEVQEVIDKIVRTNLWVAIEYKGKKYYRISNFDNNQYLRHDRYPQTIIDFPRTGDYKKAWVELEKIIEGLDVKKKTE